MKPIKFWDGADCPRPRVVVFTGAHEFVLKRRRRGKGYVARCRFCGGYLKKRRQR